MKCLQLKTKSRIYSVDNEFLAKAPLLPNRYLWEKNGHQIALFRQGEGEFLLCSDDDGFMKQYQKYYQERFELKELDSAANSGELILGSWNQSPSLETEEADDSEMADDPEVE